MAETEEFYKLEERQASGETLPDLERALIILRQIGVDLLAFRAVKELAALRAALAEANENLVSMVNQYCCKRIKPTGLPDTYSHDFMATGEQAFEYLVSRDLAEWCENGVDICNLKWPSREGDK